MIYALVLLLVGLVLILVGGLVNEVLEDPEWR
jgi:hypothetical protein